MQAYFWIHPNVGKIFLKLIKSKSTKSARGLLQSSLTPFWLDQIKPGCTLKQCFVSTQHMGRGLWTDVSKDSNRYVIWGSVKLENPHNGLARSGDGCGPRSQGGCLMRSLSEEKSQSISEDLSSGQRGRLLLCGSWGPTKDQRETGFSSHYQVPQEVGKPWPLTNTRWLRLESRTRGTCVVLTPEPDQRTYSKYWLRER